MTYTSIPTGTTNWDVPLNAGILDVQAQAVAAQATANSALTAAGNSVPKGALVLNVKDYGALGDGTTDDLAAIQNAINAAAPGNTVFFPPGVYRISNTITLKTGVTLQGSHGTTWPFRFPTQICSIRPTGSFAGECAISILGADITGSPNNEGNVRIFAIDLDGSALPAGSVSGIHAQGEVMDVILSNVSIKQFTHNGIHTNVGTGTKAPHDWFMDSVVCYNNAAFGFSMSMTDGYIRNCIASSNGQDGWLMGPFGSLTFDSCQALFNSGQGFNTSGGTQVGNLTMNNFLTDRNEKNGILLGGTVNSASGPILLNGITTNRDGRNGNAGGGGYAGIAVNTASNPVIISDAINQVGVDDNGSGSDSPQYGIRLTGNAYVAVGSGYFHGVTQGWKDDGNNTIVRRGLNIGEATGTKASPVFVYTNGVSTVDGNIDAANRALGLPRASDHNGAIAWTADPVTINGGTAPAASGTVYLSALYVPKAVTATKLFWGVSSPGLGTPVAGQNFVGIYNSAGTLLQSVNVDGRTGTNTVFTETINVSLTPGMYWVAWVFNATTLPAVVGPAGLLAGTTNFNCTASTDRWAVNGTAQTSLPSTITPSSNTNPTISRFYWAAIA